MKVVGKEREDQEAPPSVEYEPNDKSPLTDETKVYGDTYLKLSGRVLGGGG